MKRFLKKTIVVLMYTFLAIGTLFAAHNIAMTNTVKGVYPTELSKEQAQAAAKFLINNTPIKTFVAKDGEKIYLWERSIYTSSNLEKRVDAVGNPILNDQQKNSIVKMTIVDTPPLMFWSERMSIDAVNNIAAIMMLALALFVITGVAKEPAWAAIFGAALLLLAVVGSGYISALVIMLCTVPIYAIGATVRKVGKILW